GLDGVTQGIVDVVVPAQLLNDSVGSKSQPLDRAADIRVVRGGAHEVLLLLGALPGPVPGGLQVTLMAGPSRSGAKPHKAVDGSRRRVPPARLRPRGRGYWTVGMNRWNDSGRLGAGRPRTP